MRGFGQAILHPLLTVVLALLVFSYVSAAQKPATKYIYANRSLLVKENPLEKRTPAKKPEYVAHKAGDLTCRPFGECSPCPKDELDQAFCLPFGNRRLLHCIPAYANTSMSQQGEVPAWEACGKVVKKETQDFYEFVTANLLFLIVALTILWARTSALAAEQYRQLAARIGIPGGNWVTAG
ncbi:hypothetical protein I307_04201 [Cryptococcus deuterogattii 99/473]|uniref:PSI domain-containing protein n=2 Tax=Cryptococcus deuterogattii TaxID=1859096 RepID=A0A0D0VE05_9TREE|nr:hypothetical protein CNBG_0990 [Cryptococcus deuterogattii R265]KIR26450.1 hypothetical protein I309_04606 [Cryptococcus deuterogattii LA55]KIR35976.1 hypothetical protein I352_00918 [Cryptococcus deuterogattii MMRL2647]KIR43065.1 hypothetical protein I313_01274 [Cryptococcus deuterogattii Ram5]KIR75409.1 hypothetical protein I310_00100 [Cryptococcus deuterogattii CA1014]KIR95350.1 hypothetical protein I304_00099 [Cryptococcus deuterogattii CBS 10090]KIS01845.1 hypothetical protein L804_00